MISVALSIASAISAYELPNTPYDLETEFKPRFENCISSFSFRVPELEYLSWDQLYETMLDIIEETTENDYLIEILVILF